MKDDKKNESEDLIPEDKAGFAVPEPGEGQLRHIVKSQVVPEIDDGDEEALVRGEQKTLATPERNVDAVTGAPEGDRFEKWFVLLLFVFGTLAVLGSAFEIGMAWDEAFYMDASNRTLEWASGVLNGEQGLFSEEQIDRVWDVEVYEPKGHPPLTRWLGALGLMVNGGESGGMPLFALRWPFAVCFGLTLSFLYLLMRMAYGRVTAWIAVVAYFCMPRIFGHAHFGLTETPLNMFAVILVFSFLRGLKDWRWAFVTGLIFGLTLATKINAFFFIPILWLWAFVYHRRDAVLNIYAMVFIAPVVLIAVWPWLWHDTLVHLVDYLEWNVGRGGTPVFFNGLVYGLPEGKPAPWSYAPTMLFLTVPVVTLVLAALGFARILREPRRQATGTLFLFAVVVQVFVIMLPMTPAYDGVRLFLPAFPFLAALAGIGGGVLVRSVAWFDRPERTWRPGALAAGGIIIIIMLTGGWGMLRCNPFYLTYFNVLAGSREKVYAKQEIIYWGEVVNRSVTEKINQEVAPGSSLSVRGMNLDVLRYMQRWGWLDEHIEVLKDPLADYLLVQHRRGMLNNPYHPIDTAVSKDGQVFGYELRAVFPGKDNGVPLATLWKRVATRQEIMSETLGKQKIE